MSSMQIKFLSIGSGSSGNSYLLSDGETTIMIDAGVGIRNIKKALKDSGFSLSDVSAILITHDHTDHIKSLNHIGSGDVFIPVYSTVDVHKGIERNYCMQNKLSDPMVKIVAKSTSFAVGTMNVTPFEVPHDSSDNVGYRIDFSNGETFVLATDIGHLTSKIEEQISVANYLVIEANYDESMLSMGKYPQHLKDRIKSPQGHLSNRETADALCRLCHPGLKNIWLCHLSEENNHPELCRKTIESSILGSMAQLEVLRRKVPTLYILQ